MDRQVGILMMKDENDILEEYLEKITQWYDTILVLDGSKSDEGREICAKFPEVVFYEKDWVVTDEKPGDYLRGILYEKIGDICPEKTWVGILHPDEFPSGDVLGFLEWVQATYPATEAVMLKNVEYFPHISQKDSWKFEAGDKLEPLMKWAMLPGWDEFRYIKYDKNLHYAKVHGQVVPYKENYQCCYPSLEFFHHKHFTFRSVDQISQRIRSRTEAGWHERYNQLSHVINNSIFFDKLPTQGYEGYPQKML